jgi:uncharacterized protein involved in exopolysaccharide biosynthesis
LDAERWSDLRLTDIVAVLLRHGRWLALILVLGALLGGLASFLMTPRFTATASLLPEGGAAGASSSLGNLIGISGLNLGSRGREAFFGDIVRSDRVMNRLFDRRWSVDGAPDSVGLAEFLADTDESELGARDRAKIKRSFAQHAVAFSRDDETGFMRLAVTVPRSPELSAKVANAILDELKRVESVLLRSRAADEREFIEERLVEVRGDLMTAEARRAEFMSRNRAYAESPELSIRYSELSREVDLQTNIWTDLRRRLEMVKIDEVRESVPITVLDRATPPLVRSAPNRRLAVVAGFFIGFCIACAAAFWLAVRDVLGLGAPPGLPGRQRIEEG